MHSISTSALAAPSNIAAQADRVRRRIAASDSVAALVAELAFGPTRRGDVAALASMTASRVAGAGCRT